MPKFIVTHGSILPTKGGTPAKAGSILECDAKEVAGVGNVLPFVEGEQSLAAFVEDGGKPSAYHAALLTRRAAKAAKAAKPVESKPVDPKEK